MSEAARADLYNGLTETLGPARAGTLMSMLPAYDYDQLVTKTDLKVFKAELKAELGEEISAMGASLNARIDRLFYLLVLVMVAVLGAMTTLYLA